MSESAGSECVSMSGGVSLSHRRQRLSASVRPSAADGIVASPKSATQCQCTRPAMPSADNPIEPAEPPAPHLSRFPALALFRRLTSAHLHPGVMQASENLTAADVSSASTAPTCSQLDEYSVRTPYEFPDRSVHRTGMRTHRIVPGVIDPHNRQILGILFKAMEQTR